MINPGPVYGEEPAEVLRRLRKQFRQVGERLIVDVSPADVAEKLGGPLDVPARAPELMPELLWEWVKTSTTVDDEAPVEPYFTGIHGESYRVGIIWRAHVPEAGERLWPRLDEREVVEAPIGPVRELLAAEEVRMISLDTGIVGTVSPTELRPGDRIILSTDRGMLDDFGWNPTSRDLVMDVSLAENGLPLARQALKSLNWGKSR